MSNSTPAVHAATTLAELFQLRSQATPAGAAYRQFNFESNRWQHYNWQQTEQLAAQTQAWLRAQGLQAGDRIALMLHNCIDWVVIDIAAAGLGIITVPLFVNDRPGNVQYILEKTQCKLFFIKGESQWKVVQRINNRPIQPETLVSVEPTSNDSIKRLTHCIADYDNDTFSVEQSDASALATIVFTSGTTGRPKGVMLSHENIISNITASTDAVPINNGDRLLSFLPLSHMFERTIGYYAPMMFGAEVCFNRSIEKIGNDLELIQPTVLISVPRIYERIHHKLTSKLEQAPQHKRKLFALARDVGFEYFEYQQGQRSWSPRLLLYPLLSRLIGAKLRKIFGGQLRFAISGGAPLDIDINRLFVSLGVNILQGYGLTECSPVISVNRLQHNVLGSVGEPLEGIEVKLDELDELLVRGPCVMQGYWQDEEATEKIIDPDGWLHTGDMARLEHNSIYITGRLKEIIVLSTGEKIAPADVEAAICHDPLFDQAMVVGEQKPSLSAIVVLNSNQVENLNWNSDQELENLLLERIKAQLGDFPGYAQIYHVHPEFEAWSTENKMLTPTLKFRRKNILQHYQKQVNAFYTDN